MSRRQTQGVEKVSTQIVEKKVEVEKIVTQEVEKVVEKAAKDYTTPHPILSDVRIRQAIAHCSNRDDMIASVYTYVDDATKPKLRMDSWIPKTSGRTGGPYSDYEFTPEKGAALLDEAGWKLPEGETSARTTRVRRCL